MYKKPTKEQAEFAMAEGWDKEDAERGYCKFYFDFTEMLEINAINDCYVEATNGNYYYGEEVTDEDCAYEAEHSGYCKIIPIDELPAHFDRRYYGWVDTPENRKAIQEYSDKYCVPKDA